MNKVAILKRMQVTMKTFVPPFFDHFSLSLSRKKGGNENHEKETKYFHTSAASLLPGADAEILEREDALCRSPWLFREEKFRFRWSKKAEITLETISF